MSSSRLGSENVYFNLPACDCFWKIVPRPQSIIKFISHIVSDCGQCVNIARRILRFRLPIHILYPFYSLRFIIFCNLFVFKSGLRWMLTQEGELCLRHSVPYMGWRRHSISDVSSSHNKKGDWLNI